jgi:hypothetical protein
MVFFSENLISRPYSANFTIPGTASENSPGDLSTTAIESGLRVLITARCKDSDGRNAAANLGSVSIPYSLSLGEEKGTMHKAGDLNREFPMSSQRARTSFSRRRIKMEKQIMRWSYWLGVVSVVLAIVTRFLNTLGLPTMLLQTRGNSISYRSFVDGALLFLVTSIATAGFAWFKRQST